MDANGTYFPLDSIEGVLYKTVRFTFERPFTVIFLLLISIKDISHGLIIKIELALICEIVLFPIRHLSSA